MKVELVGVIWMKDEGLNYGLSLVNIQQSIVMLIVMSMVMSMVNMGGFMVEFDMTGRDDKGQSTSSGFWGGGRGSTFV